VCLTFCFDFAFVYNPQGFISSITNPASVHLYTYDANGNVTSITPPGRPNHTFSYTPVDLEETYGPPDIGIGNVTTQYHYNLDKQLDLVTRPDGQTITLNYDTGGRLSNQMLPGNITITYGYDPTTGNLSSITAQNSTLSYTYDGSLLKQTTWTIQAYFTVDLYIDLMHNNPALIMLLNYSLLEFVNNR
jgi:YD repeat-containing protein